MNLLKSLNYSLANQVSLFLINIVTMMIMARQIDPIYFGYFAIYLAFYAIIAPFQDMGLGQAYIKIKNPTENDRNIFFTLNIMLSVVMIVLLFLSILFVGNFYDIENYEVIIYTMSVSILIHSLGIQSRTHLAKEMKFKSLFIITTWGGFSSSVVSILISLYLNSIWPLLVKALLNSIISYIITRRYETNKLKFVTIREILTITDSLRYSFGIFANRVILGLSQALDQLIIAKIYGVSRVSFYSKSVDISRYPNSLIFNVLDAPFFSIINKNTIKKNKAYDAYILIGMVAAGFLSLSLLVTGDLFVNILLGPKWIEAQEYIKILSVFVFGKSMVSIFTFILINEKKVKELFLINTLSLVMPIMLSLLALQIYDLSIVEFIFIYSLAYFSLSLLYFLKTLIEFSYVYKSKIIIIRQFLLLFVLPIVSMWLMKENLKIYIDFFQLILLYFVGYGMVFLSLLVVEKEQFNALKNIITN